VPFLSFAILIPDTCPYFKCFDLYVTKTGRALKFKVNAKITPRRA
jgi:hypothetical protein